MYSRFHSSTKDMNPVIRLGPVGGGKSEVDSAKRLWDGTGKKKLE